MKIQIASDLHLEMLGRLGGQRIVEPADDADLLVLAGDIHSHLHAISSFEDWPVPIVYVYGNHEAYGAQLPALVAQLRARAQQTRIHFLECDVLEFMGTRFLGTCLWSDYQIGGDPTGAMAAAQDMLPDFKVITYEKDAVFRPDDAASLYRHACDWLDKALSVPFDGKTVVVTHHGPHPNSIDTRFEGSILNGAFVSDLTALVTKADLWIHGHVHASFDYRVGACRVLANPRGYATNMQSAATFDDLNWENGQFDPVMVVDLGP